MRSLKKLTMVDRFDDSMPNFATIPLFDHDAYARSFSATVLDVRDDLIALDRTMFYPAGGGQPGDSGFLQLKSGTARVVETGRLGEKKYPCDLQALSDHNGLFVRIRLKRIS